MYFHSSRPFWIMWILALSWKESFLLFSAVDSKEVTTTILPTLSNKADEKETNSSRQDKAIEEEDDDLVRVLNELLVGGTLI